MNNHTFPRKAGIEFINAGNLPAGRMNPLFMKDLLFNPIFHIVKTPETAQKKYSLKATLNLKERTIVFAGHPTAQYCLR